VTEGLAGILTEEGTVEEGVGEEGEGEGTVAVEDMEDMTPTEHLLLPGGVGIPIEVVMVEEGTTAMVEEAPPLRPHIVPPLVLEAQDTEGDMMLQVTPLLLQPLMRVDTRLHTHLTRLQRILQPMAHMVTLPQDQVRGTGEGTPLPILTVLVGTLPLPLLLVVAGPQPHLEGMKGMTTVLGEEGQVVVGVVPWGDPVRPNQHTSSNPGSRHDHIKHTKNHQNREGVFF
jgi:hypothetical protein